MVYKFIISLVYNYVIMLIIKCFKLKKVHSSKPRIIANGT